MRGGETMPENVMILNPERSEVFASQVTIISNLLSNIENAEAVLIEAVNKEGYTAKMLTEAAIYIIHESVMSIRACL